MHKHVHIDTYTHTHTLERPYVVWSPDWSLEFICFSCHFYMYIYMNVHIYIYTHA